MAGRFRWALPLAVGAASTLGVLTQTTPAFADSSPSAASQFVADINALRASHGLSRLVVNSTLTSVAWNWSQQMAGAGTLSHNPSLAADLPSGWQKGGENVGVGPDVASLQQAFVNSPEHYANMVDPAFNQIGVAVDVTSSGTMWVTEDYMEAPLAAAPAPAPVAPAPAPSVAPARPVVTSGPAPTIPAPAPVAPSARPAPP